MKLLKRLKLGLLLGCFTMLVSLILIVALTLAINWWIGEHARLRALLNELVPLDTLNSIEAVLVVAGLLGLLAALFAVLVGEDE